MYKRSFKEDFITPDYEATDQNFGFNHFRILQLAEGVNIAAKRERYPEIRDTIEAIVAQGDPSKNNIFQRLILPSLRHVWLTESPSEAVTEEIVYLLSTVMKSNPIDVDVLADALAVSQHKLSKETVEEYVTYIEGAIEELRTTMLNLVPTAKEKYETAATNQEKLGAIIFGKRIERYLKSCQYAEEKLAAVKKQHRLD